MSVYTRPVDVVDIKDAGNKGPQMHKTKTAQIAVDEFLASSEKACEVDWKRIDSDFDIAKKALNYRVSYTKLNVGGDACDLAVRSSRSEGRIYLVHTGK